MYKDKEKKIRKKNKKTWEKNEISFLSLPI